MKNIIMILGLTAILSACGSKGDSGSVSEVEGRDPITVADIESFVGIYDLVQADTDDCAASLQITRVCDGIQIRSNTSVKQSFCNVNKGEIKTGDNRSSTTVTLEENVLKSIATIFDERSVPAGSIKDVYTNVLTLVSNDQLLKEADVKTGKSRCLYEKR